MLVNLQLEDVRPPYVVGDVRYPRSIETVWDDQELAAIGLFKLEIDPKPEDVEILGTRRVFRSAKAFQEWIVGDPIPPPPVRRILRSVVLDRIVSVGLDEEAFALFDALPRLQKELWNSRIDVPVDDPFVLGLISALDLDPDVMLAEEFERSIKVRLRPEALEAATLFKIDVG